jgi:lipoprotein-releasing system permease protein
MNLVADIAWTHVTARPRQTAVAVIGVATGIVLTVLVSALMDGMRKEIIRSLVDAMAHVTISDERRVTPRQPAEGPYAAVQSSNTVTAIDRRTGIRKPTEVIASIRGWLPGAIAPSVRTSGMFDHGSQKLGVTINGIDPRQEESVSKLATKMRSGQLSDLYRGANAVVIGEGLAKKTGVTVGNSVTLSGGEGVSIPVTVVGTFRLGLQALDESQVYTLLRTAQVLLGKSGVVNEMRIRLVDAQAAGDIARQIETQTGYRAVSWQEANADILSTLAMQRLIAYLVIVAMLFGSTLGIYSVISTITNEKRSDIAIMKSFGMREGRVRSIFIFEAIIIGTVGGLIGWGLAWGACKLVAQLKTLNGITGEMQPIPVDYTTIRYLVIAAITLVACSAAGFFPARKASSVHPVDIIRGAS